MKFICSTQLTWDTWECLESCWRCGPVCLAVFLWGRREDRERATQRECSGSCTRLTDVNAINWAELLSVVISVFTSPHVLQYRALTSSLSHTHTHTYTHTHRGIKCSTGCTKTHIWLLRTYIWPWNLFEDLFTMQWLSQTRRCIC